MTEQKKKTKNEKRGKAMSIGMWIITIIGGAVGILSTLYIVASIFAVLIYKIYRKAKYHISLYN